MKRRCLHKPNSGLAAEQGPGLPVGLKDMLVCPSTRCLTAPEAETAGWKPILPTFSPASSPRPLHFHNRGPPGRKQVQIRGLQARFKFSQIQTKHRRTCAGLWSKQRSLETSPPPAGVERSLPFQGLGNDATYLHSQSLPKTRWSLRGS